MLLLLPGLDGTARLFAPLVAALAARDVEARAVAYPTDHPLPYDDLAQFVLDGAPPGPWHVLGESFSGPVAIRLAAEHPSRVAGLVLCATFATPPVPSALPRIASWLPQPMPPAALVRTLLAGHDAPTELVRDVQAAIGSVSSAVLRARFRALASVDVVDALSVVQAPILSLEATDDRLVGATSATRMTDAAPHAHRVRIPGPHLIAQRRPDLVADAITSWIRATSA